METLDQSWRGFKCRLKRDHYYMYDTYEERLKYPLERVPEAHYKTLLAYWGTPIAKKTSLQNSENRREQDNIHTTGPVSFAMKHEQLLRKDGVAPSKRKMFEETRRRKEGRTYDRPYGDTQQKIQAMRELEASQDDQSGEPVKDPFDEVMRNIRPGTELLQGLGVTRKKRKDKGPGTSLILPEEVMECIKSVVTSDVQKDINAEIEEFAKEKEVHAAQVAAQEAEIERKTKELESKTLKLQEIRMDIENQLGNIPLDALISALAQLRQKDPSLTQEIIAKAIVSTTTNDA